jgi:hypothetical protein
MAPAMMMLRAHNWLLFACICVPWARSAAHGQAQPGWQPFRELPAVTPAQAIEPTIISAVDLPMLDGTTPVGPEMLPPEAVVSTTYDPAMVCPQPIFAAPAASMPPIVDPMSGVPTGSDYWRWRLLPEGVVWQSYWAGAHESRIAGIPFADQHGTALLDVALGGRASLVRYGTESPGRPLGGELQIEGAAFPRLNLDENWDVDATDFRFGLPLVYGQERWEAKFSYYHLSAHMGDEFAIREAALGQRINFSRDALVAALAFYPLPAWRWYAEMGWAFHYDGGAEPWEFQFGVDVAQPGPTGWTGTPFFAVNGHLREEHNFGGNVVFQAGWLWRGHNTRLMRLGFHYYNGKSNQFEFFDQFEEQLGGGLWYDF